MFLTETGLVWRGIRPLQKLGVFSRGNPLAEMMLAQHVPQSLRVVPPDPWSGDALRGRDMLAGVVRFAGQTFEKDSLSWAPPSARAEWLSALHGFEWLRDLRSVGGDRARRMARDMVASWLVHHTKTVGAPWAPETTGMRLAAWISFHDFFCASADDEFRKAYFTGLVRQAKYLARNLPGAACGLGLLRALKGLAYAGLALEGGEEWLAQAFMLIGAQIREQILPDGGHISRAPEVTFAFLHDLVDLRTALVAARVEMPEELQHAIDRLAPAVKFFRHGDGAFCHFNGGRAGNANICDATLMHSGARGRAMKTMPHSGYEKLAQGRAQLIMDTGLPVLSRYSDRAHAGLLSFEYGYGKDRIFVNCGTVDVPGRWRDLLRTTAAHTALVVDNRNACSFDARGCIAAPPDVRCKKGEDAGIAMIEAGHNGYVPRYGLTHVRRLRLLESGNVLTGEDHLQGRSGVHFAVRFHLHPAMQASLIQDGETVLLRARSGMGWRFHATGLTPVLEESIYAGEDEAPRHTTQIVLHGETAGLETVIGWALRREKM